MNLDMDWGDLAWFIAGLAVGLGYWMRYLVTRNKRSSGR